MRFKRIFLCAVMAGCLSVPVSAEPLPTVELISVMDAVKPAIPKETGYAVVNLNIRKSPDKNSEIAGKYKKGEKVNILSDDGTWARTDMGYVWGGYLAKEYKCDLSIRSDSEEASRYVGYVYDMYNNMEAKYLKYLEPYDICVCDNPRQSYDGTLSENTITDGLTHLSKGIGVCERLLFLRANKEGLSQAVYHELGHIIDFNDFNSDSFMSDSQTVVDSMEAEMPALKEKYHISDQNTSTRMEYFAEAFRLSFSDPDGLRETAPHIASYMENMKAQI